MQHLVSFCVWSRSKERTTGSSNASSSAPSPRAFGGGATSKGGRGEGGGQCPADGASRFQIWVDHG